MSDKQLTQEEMLDIDYTPPRRNWLEPSAEFRKGTYCYSAPQKHHAYLDLPNPRQWQPFDDDWQLPENWKDLILEGMEDRLK